LRMKLKNFTKYTEKEIDFSNITKISGMNGAGKSSIATAYTWVLFDCDYNLKSSPAVRREVAGEPVMDSDVEATLIFDLDGKEISMRKIQHRTVSKDGASYKDDNKYFINDVPKKKAEFESYLGIDMGLLKSCSNPEAFLIKKADEMRTYLFSLSKEFSDLYVCWENESLHGLAEKLEDYSVEELSAMNKKKKSDIEKDLPVLDGQIKEKERDIKLKSDIDVSDLELQRNTLKEQIAENLKKQADSQNILKDYEAATAGIMELKFKLSDMQNQANNALSEKVRKIRSEIAEKTAERRRVEIESDNYSRKVEILKDSIKRLTEDKKKMAELWQKEKARVFDENSTVCVYCGQEYPEDKKEQLRSEFAVRKEAELKRITDKGMSLKKTIEEDEQEVEKLNDSLKEKTENLRNIEEEIRLLKEKETKIPVAADIFGNEEYKKIQSQIAVKEKYLEQFGNTSDLKEQLKQEESNLNEQLRTCEQKIAQSDTSAEEERLEELKARKLDLGQKKTDAEHILDLLAELEKNKNEMLSDEINSHFGLVKWVLFEYAKNGNYKSICIPQVDEKSILTTISNKGNRILGKLDICRSIQKIEGISVPIWLDDCESLDSENQKKVIDMVDGQLIMLIVNDGKELKVEG
jgi:chromosome segregation ATPase